MTQKIRMIDKEMDTQLAKPCAGMVFFGSPCKSEEFVQNQNVAILFFCHKIVNFLPNTFKN